MIARNQPYRFRGTARNPVPPAHRLAERLRHYFDQHPQVSREDFLLGAIQKEIDSRAADIGRSWRWDALEDGQRVSQWDDGRRPLTAEDIRIHAWLNERLALLHHKRHGWWARVRRFLGL